MRSSGWKERRVSGFTNGWFAGQEGMSLAEVVVAVAILFIALPCFALLLEYVAQAAQINRVRLYATELAASRLEDARAYDFDLINSLNGTDYKSADGVTYTVRTGVYDETVNNVATGAKIIEINVTAPVAALGTEKKTVDITARLVSKLFP